MGKSSHITGPLGLRWVPSYYGYEKIAPVVNAAGQLSFTPAAGGEFQAGGITTVAGLNFTSRSVSIQLVKPLNSIAGNGTVFTSLEVGTAPNSNLRWIHQDGILLAQKGDGVTVGKFPYDAALDKWLRIRDCGTNGIAWETSADGVTYSTYFVSQPVASLTDVGIVAGAACQDSGTFEKGTAIFDNVAFA